MSAGAPLAAANRRPTLDRVLAYWEQTHDAYLAHVGTTFQAGRIAAGRSMCESNLWLARAAGLRAGTRVLDAGCGVCGPAIDIARAIPGISIVAITVSRRQATAATSLILDAALSHRIQVVTGDYHVLPFADTAFDTVFFFESVGYASSLPRLFTSVHRVLRPGGFFYIKDVFRREPLWSDQERQELSEFDEVFAVSVPALTECVEAAREVGFTEVATRDLSDLVSTAHAWRAMFDTADQTTLSGFGQRHHRRYTSLPVYFAELTARRAPA